MWGQVGDRPVLMIYISHIPYPHLSHTLDIQKEKYMKKSEKRKDNLKTP